MFARAESPASAPAAPQEEGLKIGGATVRKTARSVTFAALVNMREGALEYLLVSKTGKTHESLLCASVRPLDIHIAMLLLGARESAEISAPPPAHLDAAYLKTAPGLSGDAVEIILSWQQDGKRAEARAEDWILCRERPAARGPWLYNGSALYGKRFLAQEEGSIVALVTDPAALANNPREGRDDDGIWSANTERIPPVGTPVEVRIQFGGK